MTIKDKAEARIEAMPESSKKDLLTIALAMFMAAKFVFTRPLWPFRVMRNSRQLGVYGVAFDKQIVWVMLLKMHADGTLGNRENQPAVQYVWKEVLAEVARNPAYENVKVPDLHQWRNMNRNGDYVVRIVYICDATKAERKRARLRPFREGVREFFSDVSA